MKTLLTPCLLAIYGMVGCVAVPPNTLNGGSRAAFVDEVGSGEEEQVRPHVRRFEPVDEVGSGEEEAAEEYRNRRPY